MGPATRLGNSLQVILFLAYTSCFLIVLTIEFLKKAATFIDEYVKLLDDSADSKSFVLFVTLGVISAQSVHLASDCSTSNTGRLFCPPLHQTVWVGTSEKHPLFPSMSTAPNPSLIHL